jgi:hypothetical protein
LLLPQGFSCAIASPPFGIAAIRWAGHDWSVEHRSKLDCDVHDLLDEANVILLLPIHSADVARAHALIKRLLACTDEAKAAKQQDSEQRLRDAAEAIRSRLP